MKYFSGFSFDNESNLFDEYLNREEFCVAGFSYGAQNAFEYAYSSKTRVDILQLFSPAFFNNKSIKFKRLQMMFYNKNPKDYEDNFTLNSLFPSTYDISNYIKSGTKDELESLLYYEWNESRVKELINRGTKIEVYLGDMDKIIDYRETKEFFIEFAMIFTIKNSGHILRHK